MSKKNHDEGTDRETAVAESLAASEAEAVALEAPAPEVADAAEAPPAGAPTPKRGRDRELRRQEVAAFRRAAFGPGVVPPDEPPAVAPVTPIATREIRAADRRR